MSGKEDTLGFLTILMLILWLAGVWHFDQRLLHEEDAA